MKTASLVLGIVTATALGTAIVSALVAGALTELDHPMWPLFALPPVLLLPVAIVTGIVGTALGIVVARNESRETASTNTNLLMNTGCASLAMVCFIGVLAVMSY